MKKDRKRAKKNAPDDGIIEIPDDTSERKIVEFKQKTARTVKRLNENTRRIGPRLSGFAYGLIIVVILLIVYIIADLSTGGFLYTVNGKFVSLLSGGASEDFSVAIDGDNVYDFRAFDNGYAILTENGISFVKKSGDISSSQQITYSSPSVDVSGSKAIVYDRGNTSFLRLSNERVTSQLTVENGIIDVAVSERDNYAVAVRDAKAKSILYGMDSRGDIIYQWNCPDGYVSDIAITSSGSKAAVSVINAKNAVVSSKIYVLDFDYDSAYAEFDYPGETVVGSKFLSNRKIQVITDKNIYLINGKEQQVVFEFGTDDICYTGYSDKFVAVITKNYTDDESYSLTLLGKNGKIRFTAQLSGRVKGLSVSDKSVAVLFTDKTETYSKYGKLVGSVSDLNHYDGIVINGNYVYILSSDSVKKYAAYGNVSMAVEEEVTE